MTKPLKQKKMKIPKGYKIWRTIETYPYYLIIASKKDLVSIFEFDYESENPTKVWHYPVFTTPSKSKPRHK